METSLWQNREVIWMPNAGPQTAFLASPAREVFYGGAAAGGKTDAIIAGALRYADHPLHRAILLRRTRPQLQEVIDRTKVLYPEIVPGAYWIERENRWYLPAGGYIQMGYSEHEDDILAFKTFEYNYIGFDELTSFSEKMYTFMFSRNRSKSRDLPLQVRAASNPGDIGHEWVYKRFIRNRSPFEIYEEKETLRVGDKKFNVAFTRQFIPAKVSDNPKLPDAEGYIAGLLQMGEDGQMYLHGVWRRVGGTMFKRLPAEVPAKISRPQNYAIMSMDYGLNDPTACHWALVYDDNSVEITGELYVNELDLDELYDKIMEKEKAIGLKAPLIRVADPKIFARESDKQSIASVLASKGLNFEKANNDRVFGWAQVQRYIWNGRWKIWLDRAPELLRTLPNLMRHPTKPNDIKDRQEDHAADSARYLLVAVYESLAGIDAVRREGNGAQREERRDTEFDKMTEGLRNNNGAVVYEGLGIWT